MKRLAVIRPETFSHEDIHQSAEENRMELIPIAHFLASEKLNG